MRIWAIPVNVQFQSALQIDHALFEIATQEAGDAHIGQRTNMVGILGNGPLQQREALTVLAADLEKEKAAIAENR